MYISVLNHEIPVLAVHEERQLKEQSSNGTLGLQDVPSRRIRLTEDGISREALQALIANDWQLMGDNGTVTDHKNFRELLYHEITLIGADEDGSSEELLELREENEKIIQVLPDLLIGQPAEIALKLWQYFPAWEPRNWVSGENCLYNNYPYKVAQAHNSTGIPDWNPAGAPSLFAVWHGVSIDTALPWKAPTGGHDIYKVDEHMIWTDGTVMKCIQDTAYSPAEYPQAWTNA